MFVTGQYIERSCLGVKVGVLILHWKPCFSNWVLELLTVWYFLFYILMHLSLGNMLKLCSTERPVLICNHHSKYTFLYQLNGMNIHLTFELVQGYNTSDLISIYKLWK